MIAKKNLLFCILILIFIPLVYAGNYGEGIYGIGSYGIGNVISENCGDGICNNGETCSSCSGDCGDCVASSSGGGGGSSCSYDWQCTSWFPSECPVLGIQERICMNKGTCTGTSGIPNQNQTCIYEHKEPLFDIFLTLQDNYREICSGEIIKASIKLENYGKIELLDAFMTYWIIDENNSLIIELKDTRAVTNKKDFEIELKIPELTAEGTYKIYAQINYDKNKTAVAGESFEILSDKNCRVLSTFNWMYLMYFGIGIIIILLVLILIKLFKSRRQKAGKAKSHTEYRTRIKENLKKIIAKHFLLFFYGFIIVIILFNVGNKMKGFVVGNSAVVVTESWYVIKIILIMTVLGLLIFLYRNKIKIVFERIIEKVKTKHPKNRIKGLIKKKVYSENGDYIGKVEEIFLRNNKIDSLKIKLDLKHRFKVKVIVVKYEYVKSVGDVIIIDEKILGHLNNYR